MSRWGSYGVEICLRILTRKLGTPIDSIVEEIVFGSDSVGVLNHHRRLLLIWIRVFVMRIYLFWFLKRVCFGRLTSALVFYEGTVGVVIEMASSIGIFLSRWRSLPLFELLVRHAFTIVNRSDQLTLNCLANKWSQLVFQFWFLLFKVGRCERGRCTYASRRVLDNLIVSFFHDIRIHDNTWRTNSKQINSVSLCVAHAHRRYSLVDCGALLISHRVTFSEYISRNGPLFHIQRFVCIDNTRQFGQIGGGCGRGRNCAQTFPSGIFRSHWSLAPATTANWWALLIWDCAARKMQLLRRGLTCAWGSFLSASCIQPFHTFCRLRPQMDQTSVVACLGRNQCWSVVECGWRFWLRWVVKGRL